MEMYTEHTVVYSSLEMIVTEEIVVSSEPDAETKLEAQLNNSDQF